jgi:thiol-disulfide isomerase/thioredoxin
LEDFMIRNASIAFLVLLGAGCATTQSNTPGAPRAGLTPTVSFSDTKPTLLVFWASWCVPCNKEAPVIARLFRETTGRLDIIGVNVDTDASAADAFADKHALPYRSYADPDLAIADRFGVTGTPALVVLGPDGAFVVKGSRLAEVAPALTQLLSAGVR